MIDKELLKKFEIEITEKIRNNNVIRIKIEGRPREGKSTLAAQINNYLNKILSEDRE